MRHALLACLVLLHVAPAGAQRRLVHDTLGRDMPTAVTCGFCSGERFGVVFRELPPPRRGLEPSDFPITLDTIEIGLAAADVPAGECVARDTGGTVNAAVEVWTGDTPPSGAINGLSATDAWSPTERLVWATDAAPLALSIAETSGSDRYELMFNVLEIRDETETPITIDSGAYVRIVVTLPVGTPESSSLCEPSFESPGGYPVRDNDGRIAPERNFIYAAGAGWFWSEDVPGGSIDGDWGIRMQFFASGTPGTDGGVTLDGSVGVDGGALDGSAAADAASSMDGGADPAGGGCGCRAASGRAGWLLPLSFAGALLLARRRRRRSAASAL